MKDKLREAIKQSLENHSSLCTTGHINESFNDILRIVADHDLALKNKLLGVLPEEKEWDTIQDNNDSEGWVYKKVYNQALSESKLAIERLFNE